MSPNFSARCLAFALATALSLPAAVLANTQPDAPSAARAAAPKTPAPTAGRRPAQPQPAPAAQPQAKPHHHWPRVSLLKTIVIVGVAAAATGIIVWRSYKVPYACGACTPPPAP